MQYFVGTLHLTDIFLFQNFFSAFLGQLDGLINELRNSCGVNGEVKDEKNLEDEDQWNNFQNSFKVIEMCGKLCSIYKYLI